LDVDHAGGHREPVGGVPSLVAASWSSPSRAGAAACRAARSISRCSRLGAAWWPWGANSSAAARTGRGRVGRGPA